MQGGTFLVSLIEEYKNFSDTFNGVQKCRWLRCREVTILRGNSTIPKSHIKCRTHQKQIAKTAEEK